MSTTLTFTVTAQLPPDHKGRLDGRGRVYDATGADDTSTMTVAIAEADLLPTEADFLVTLSAVPLSFIPGRLVVDFTDDDPTAAGNTVTADLAEYVAAALIALLSPGAGVSGWPTVANVEARLAAAGLALRSSADVVGALADVVAEVERETQQQFIADTVDSIRFYDGSGTPELEVDPMVSLTAIAALISATDTIGTPYPYARLIAEIGRPLTRIIVAQGSAWQMYPQSFLAGRQNIRVTGKFGYGATVPPDLWAAVAGEAASRLAGEAVHTGRGRIQSRQIDAVRVAYFDNSDVGSWHARYLKAIDRYSRSLGRQLRLWKPRMV